MKKGKTLTVVVLVLIIISSSIYGKGDQEISEDDKTIELLTFYNFDGGPRQIAFKEIVDKFTEETGISIKYNIVPWNEVNQQLILSELSGNSPDISFVEGEKFALHMAENTLRPLTDYINKDFSEADINDHLNWDFGVHTDGEKYVFPISYLAMAMFVRSDLLESNNLQVPTTWEEFIDAGKKINSQNIPGFLFPGSPAQATQLNWLQPILENRGGKILDENGRAVFNSKAGVETFEFLRSVIYEHEITPVDVGSITYDEVTDMFASGRTGMIFEGSHRYKKILETLDKEKLTVAAIPGVDKTSPSPTTVVGWTLGIPRGSKHPDEAWEFIKFFNQTENALAYAKNSGEIPFLESVSNNAYFNEPEQEIVKFFVEYIGDHGISIASPPKAEELVVILAETIQRVILEKDTSIQKILDEAVNEFNSLLD